MAPSGLASLALNQLRTLALQCGVNKSGTKAALIQHLQQALADHEPLRPDARVLSIDLGIRNLAYSLLTLPAAGAVAPAVHAWRRLDLAPAAAPPDFGPAALSEIAYRLVRDRLLPLRPTHVLVERQRFRSGGGAAVYEWTVRVNSLEAMLYATLATLRGLGQWGGVVLPVDPKRVGTYVVESPADGWAGRVERLRPRAGEEGGDQEGSLLLTAGRAPAVGLEGRTRSSKENKRRKIDLVGNWLLHNEVAMAGPEAEEMRSAFLDRWLPKEQKGKPVVKSQALQGTAQSMTKLDDVADSLLQAIAWMRWDGNKTELKQGSMSCLLGRQQ